MKLPILKCERCKHKWVPRTTREPKVCPKCKSAYWNEPKKPPPITQKMNPTERRAYDWLLQQFPGQEVVYQHSVSPDFVIGNNKGYEIKRFMGYKIHLAYSQWESLNTIQDCYIAIFDSSIEPIEVIPLMGLTPPFQYGRFYIDILPDPLANYKRHLDILSHVAGKGLSGKEFWAEYHRQKEKVLLEQ